jgi:hypothetical protein
MVAGRSGRPHEDSAKITLDHQSSNHLPPLLWEIRSPGEDIVDRPLAPELEDSLTMLVPTLQDVKPMTCRTI